MNDRKIGIATLHYGHNEGAILQAYALCKLLSEAAPGAKAEIVDQRYPSKVKVYGPADTPRKQALQRAVNEWLPLSEVPFRTEDVQPVFEYINRRYEALFVGSDVVWFLRYTRRLRRMFARGILPKQRDPFCPAFPNVYWPDARVNVPKVAFAASIGKLNWKDIPRRHRRQMARILDGFDSLSVRDERTLQFLEWVDPRAAARTIIVPDPTLCYHFDEETGARDALREKLVLLGVDFSRPRLAVICDDHPSIAEVANRARARGMQVVGITTKNSYSDVTLFDASISPIEWSHLFQHFDACITDRMHGMIFCIRNGTAFIGLDQDVDVVDGDESKTKNLMRRFGIDAFRFSKRAVTSGQIERALSNIGCGEWDHLRISHILDACHSQALDYLRTVTPHRNTIVSKNGDQCIMA